MADYRLTLVTPAAAEPVDLDMAKTHLRVSGTVDDERIARLVQVARNEVETEARRALLTQTWDLKAEYWPIGCNGSIELPLPPLASVTSVTYLDVDNALTTWAATNYLTTIPAGPHAERGRITLALGSFYPILRAPAFDAVRIRFVAGYGAAGSAAPVELVQAVLMRLSYHYDGDEKAVTAASALIAPFQSRRW